MEKATLQDTAPAPPEVHTPGHEPNPWQDASSSSPVIPEHKEPDLSQLDPHDTQGFAATPEPESAERSPTKQEVLLEFDPLASAEEKAAQQAWASSEGHPPPPPPPDKDPSPSTPQPPSTPIRSSSPVPSFPSLAALARTFALPLTRGQRPRSLDSAAAVPSPATLSSFAKQQSTPSPRAVAEVPRTSTPSLEHENGGRSTPSGKGKDGEPPQFDFQKFLDQMKLKAAEPVAKYLRSYVSVPVYVLLSSNMHAVF